MSTLRKPHTDLLTALVLATAAAPALPQSVERAQLEPVASILLRDAAAELCANRARAGDGGGVANLSPAARGRLQDAGAVFKSLDYGQAAGTPDVDEQLRGLPAGSECRAQALSKLWQHFTARGRQKTEPGAAAEAGTELVAVPGVASLPVLPGAASERKSTTPESPAAVAKPATAATSRRDEAVRGGSQDARQRDAGAVAAAPALPETAPPPRESVALSRSAEPVVPGEGRAAEAAAIAPAAPAAPAVEAAAATADRTAPIGRHWPWLLAALVLMVAALARFWSRRKKRATSAQQARDRLRPI